MTILITYNLTKDFNLKTSVEKDTTSYFETLRTQIRF